MRSLTLIAQRSTTVLYISPRLTFLPQFYSVKKASNVSKPTKTLKTTSKETKSSSKLKPDPKILKTESKTITKASAKTSKPKQQEKSTTTTIGDTSPTTTKKDNKSTSPTKVTKKESTNTPKNAPTASTSSPSPSRPASSSSSSSSSSSPSRPASSPSSSSSLASFSTPISSSSSPSPSSSKPSPPSSPLPSSLPSHKYSSPSSRAMNTFENFPPLPTIGQIIKMYGLTAKQKLSQNFILDFNLIDRVCRAGGDLKDTTVIEVGPGPGSLTRGLLKAGAKRVIVVEKDSRFLPALELLQQSSGGRLTIINDDMLRVDEEELLKGEPVLDWNEKSNIRIVGNLPFNVATALMLKWLRMIPGRKGPFAYSRAQMVLMFQAEVADRIVAKPGTNEYGRLSIIAGQTCDAKVAFRIPGSAFVPPPKVDAGVVCFEPKKKILGDAQLDVVEYVCREMFSQRRKMLSNSVKRLGDGSDVILENAQVSSQLRPQQLTIAQWCQIAKAYEAWLKTNPEAMKRFENLLKKKKDTPDMIEMAARLLEDFEKNTL